MGIAYHTSYTPDGAGTNLFDRVVLGTVTVICPTAAASLGTTIAVSWNEPVPTPYTAIPSLIEDSTYFITNRTTTGCSLVIMPRLLGGTLAGGSIELLLMS